MEDGLRAVGWGGVVPGGGLDCAGGFAAAFGEGGGGAGAGEGGEGADGVAGGGAGGVGVWVAAEEFDVGFVEEGLLGRGGFFGGGTLAFAFEVFVDFGLDGVEGEVLPAVLGFDVGERETVLEEARDLGEGGV